MKTPRIDLALGTLLLAFTLSIMGCGAQEDAGAASTPDSQPVGELRAASVVVTSCPDPKSCESWSAWYNVGGPTCQSGVAGCGTEICISCHCNQDTCQTCCHYGPGPATEQLQQSFRDCTLQSGQRCRETQQQTVELSCGC